MEFFANNLYHIYNRGNNKQPIFFSDANYIYFLGKVRKYILPHCNILAYVLMPNHFHFLIHADERTEVQVTKGFITSNVVSEGFRLLLSSYTKAINKQEDRTGSLLQQNTKSKCVHDAATQKNPEYAIICYHYIHLNPLRANIANKVEDWPYSSFRDHAGMRAGTLCNKQLVSNLLGVKVNAKVELTMKTLQYIW